MNDNYGDPRDPREPDWADFLPQRTRLGDCDDYMVNVTTKCGPLPNTRRLRAMAERGRARARRVDHLIGQTARMHEDEVLAVEQFARHVLVAAGWAMATYRRAQLRLATAPRIRAAGKRTVRRRQRARRTSRASSRSSGGDDGSGSDPEPPRPAIVAGRIELDHERRAIEAERSSLGPQLACAVTSAPIGAEMSNLDITGCWSAPALCLRVRIAMRIQAAGLAILVHRLARHRRALLFLRRGPPRRLR